jgi:acyl-CoA synthetase (AMP-forming)/AMP-acid ligase II
MSSSAVKSIPNILSRDCIRDDIVFDNYSKETISFTINRVKNLLRDAGAEKGDLITISILHVNHWHIASIFACAEMGLKIMILDSPATLESLPYTKLALHGPSQFYIHDSEIDTTDIYGGLHDEMIRRYGGEPVDIRHARKTYQNDFRVDVSPDDPFLLSSTSGTTKASRPILFSHKEVYEISKRNIDVFGFEPDSFVCHSRNLHHASALLTSLFPALMGSQRHFNIPIGHDLSGEDHLLLQGYHMIRKINTTHIMIPNKATLIDFLETIKEPFKRTLNINMCGFALDEKFVELARQYNVKFLSHYGSIDTAIPFLVNFVDEDSVVEENCLGVMPDQFYGMVMKGNRVEIHSDLWDEPRYIEDELELRDGQFFLVNPRKIELPDIDLTPFMSDTKISMEQLRGHLHETGYYPKRHSD